MGTVISRNFVAFDVQAALAGNMVEIPVCSGKTSGFAPVWNAIVDDKLCMGGCGEVSCEVALPASSGMIRDSTLQMEAASRRILKKDCKEIGDPQEDHGFMRGMLSWHRQPEERHLDEAGSFEEQQHIDIPSRLLPAIEKTGGLTLTFRVKGNGGLALYGRNCGRYSFGLMAEIK